MPRFLYLSLLAALGGAGCSKVPEATRGHDSEPGEGSAAASVGSRAPSAPESSAPATARGLTGGGAAYAGCGAAIRSDQLWAETGESEVYEAIAAARRCAAQHGRRVLLEFVAPWCDDCHEMTRIEQVPRVAEVMAARFERVRINIGKWDRHEALRLRYGVRALATYVVLDPASEQVLDQTTLEPVTKTARGKLTSDAWADWLSRH